MPPMNPVRNSRVGPDSIQNNWQGHFESSEEILHACIRDDNITLLRQLVGSSSSTTTSPHVNYDIRGLGSPLHYAVICGREDAVDLLLAAGADPLMLGGNQDDGFFTPAARAASHGHRDICRKIWLSAPPDQQVANAIGRNPLLAAAMHGHASLVGDLLTLWDGWSMEVKVEAFLWSARRWHADVSLRLLESTTFETSTYQEALHAAVPNKTLLGEERGIPRYDAIDFIQQQSLIALLIDAGADPNSLSSDWPLIVVAAANGNTTGALKTLLEQGADPNKTSAQGLSALHLLASPVPRQALRSRPVAINDPAIRLLLKHHASAAQPDETGECSLHWAAFGFDDLHYFHLYLSSSPDIEAALHLKNHAGGTLLHFAALGDRLETMEFLLSRGLNVNARSSNGWTPLMCALTPGNGYVLYRGSGHSKRLQHALRTAKFLLLHGADPLIVTDEGWTPLHALALNYDDEERSGDIAGFTSDLLSRGVDPEARAPLLSPFEGQSYGVPSVPWGRRLPAAMRDPSVFRLMIKPNLAPLYWAAERGAVGVIRGLLSHGVGVSSADEGEITPTTLVAESKFLQRDKLKTASVIMDLLLEAGAGF